LNPDNWTRLLGAIALGSDPEEAIKTLSISPATVDGALRTEPKMREAWNAAKIEGGRINWPRSIITEICNKIADGSHSVRTACESVGKDRNSFLRLALRDPEVKDEYELALQMRAEHFADEVIEISNDRSRDEDWEGKGNSAAVRRSELQIKARMQLAGAANPVKYRERTSDRTSTVNVQQNVQNNVNVELNLNHAERLAAARRRRKVASETRPVLEAQYEEVPAAQGADAEDDWLDDPSK